jgi:phosphatidylglycerol:prolipoprotein diacylglycerol transferase
MVAVTASPVPLGMVVINIDPVLHLGPLQVHWYGIMYAVAFYIAWRFAVVPLATRAGVSRSIADRMTTWTIVFGLLGGRLYYVLQQPDLVSNYLQKPLNIIAFWNGGMAFFGAIIAGFITLAVCAWRYRVNPWIALDGGVLFAVVGQPIGRIGNIINGDILGPQSTLPWATAYANPNAILQSSQGFQRCFDPSHPGGPFCPAYVPAAAYEALAAIGIGLILLVLYRRRVRAGIMAISYVALYAISQLIVFQYRASEPTVLLGLHQAQWTAIGMLVIAVPALCVLWWRTSGRVRAESSPTSVDAGGAAAAEDTTASPATSPSR